MTLWFVPRRSWAFFLPVPSHGVQDEVEQLRKTSAVEHKVSERQRVVQGLRLNQEKPRATSFLSSQVLPVDAYKLHQVISLGVLFISSSMSHRDQCKFRGLFLEAPLALPQPVWQAGEPIKVNVDFDGQSGP